MGYVNGMKVVIQGISKAFDGKRALAEAAAVDISKEALRTFRQRQLGADCKPDGKAKADTLAKKIKARDYKPKDHAEAHGGNGEVTAMGIPWTNRSLRAARTVFADAGVNEHDEVYFNLYHTMSYGAYLELGNNRKYAVLEPLARAAAPKFLKRLKEIYAPD